MKNTIWAEINKKLIADIDCTKDFGENYFEIGESILVETEFGAYREAANVKGSRFGYRFQLENKQKPHLMVITYPDDKIRFMCIQNGTNFDSTTSLMTGYNYPLSYKMEKLYLLYWPRWTDDSIVFTSYSIPDEEPAAVSKIEVYELEKLPENLMDEECYKENKRTFGIQYEDPCGIGGDMGTFEFSPWIDRKIEYMKSAGLNKFIYPINWYHGPIIPVKTQPHHRFNGVTTEDRTNYGRVTFDYNDWLEELLTKFDKENLHFTGSMTLLRLGNLMALQNTDLNSVVKGGGTINNIDFEGNIQKSTNDWTRIYHALNFRRWVECHENGLLDGFDNIDYVAYGEPAPSGIRIPIFNPLHPEVQRQVLNYFDEVAAKYCHHKSFDGIQVNFWHATFLWYASLLGGYDDYSFKLFESEENLDSGFSTPDPERFKKRYKLIESNEEIRNKFVSFRCRKIHEFILKIRDTIIKHRSDLKFTLTIWNEMSFYGLMPGKGLYSHFQSEEAQFGNRYSNLEVYRMGGLDLKLFENDENIEIAVEHDCARERSHGILDLEKSHSNNDFFYLDSEVHSTLRNLKNTAGFHFDCWVELWGNHKKYAVTEKDKDNIEFINSLSDYKPEFISKENSSYDDDPDNKFFFKSQLRIASPYPAPKYFAEELTLDLALHDSLSMTSGGLYLDRVHTDIQREIAKEYRKLPAVKFDDVSSTFGPIVSRYKYIKSENKTYVYVVNREPYEVESVITFEGGTANANLPAFMLKVFIFEGEVKAISAVAKVKDEIKKLYLEESEKIITLLNKADSNLNWAKGKDIIINKMKEAIAKENFADLRHLILSYIPAKAKKELI
ncbi:MAG: hypothetical protein E7564_06100 [Ruminococcaceae bacterium]|nr:hypothetical protein [Oscillospiraceae bacterium]